jgi:hypothetical protein
LSPFETQDLNQFDLIHVRPAEERSSAKRFKETINMRTIGIFLTVSLSLFAARAVAEDACCAAACGANNCGSSNQCARCGRECGCMQCTCQLVCGKEKVKKYCWEVKCEEFCPLLPGRGCGERNAGEDGNGPCQNCPSAGQCGEKCPNPMIRTPHCGNARVKKTLVKKEYECERPKYKCVVQYLCPQCAARGESGVAPVDGAKPAGPSPAPVPNQLPARQPKTTFIAPLPPVVDAS